MSKNLIPEICKMLGVELGEEFKIKGYDGVTYMIADNKGLMATDDDPETGWTPTSALFVALLRGADEIIKLPWKPAFDERYWTFAFCGFSESLLRKWTVISNTWMNHPVDIALLDKGWAYRTKEEAEAALPKVAAEMGVEYEI